MHNLVLQKQKWVWKQTPLPSYFSFPRFLHSFSRLGISETKFHTLLRPVTSTSLTFYRQTTKSRPYYCILCRSTMLLKFNPQLLPMCFCCAICFKPDKPVEQHWSNKDTNTVVQEMNTWNVLNVVWPSHFTYSPRFYLCFSMANTIP